MERTLRALYGLRLQVNRNVIPQHLPSLDEESMAQHVIMAGTGSPPREPDATCDACGVTGTIGRALRTDSDGQITEHHRFCARCWPEQSARYRARWDEEDRLASETWRRASHRTAPPPSQGAAFESATWHATLELVRELNGALRPMPAPTPAQLAAIAADIQARRDEYEGPIPAAVEDFLQAHHVQSG